MNRGTTHVVATLWKKKHDKITAFSIPQAREFFRVPFTSTFSSSEREMGTPQSPVSPSRDRADDESRCRQWRRGSRLTDAGGGLFVLIAARI